MGASLHYTEKTNKQIRSLGLGIQFGLLAAVILLVHFLLLVASGMNYMLLHGLGKMIVIGIIMFYAFSTFKENRKRIKFASSLKLGIYTALTTAITLLLAEAILNAVTGINLAPYEFIAFEASPMGSYILLALEMMVYGILACMACTVYFKRPRTEPLNSSNTEPEKWNVLQRSEEAVS